MKSNEELILGIVKELTQNNDVTVQQLLLDEGVMDSLTTIELITRLETEFSIAIDTDDLNHHNFNTVENITALVNQKTAK
jgi:acyl carrier protein